MSEAYKKLIKTLRTLFEMDKADLDFGIYRILNQKREEIDRFLEHDLLPQVKEAFADYAGGGKADLQTELEQAIEQARQFGAPDPEQAPPVLAIKAQLASAVDITAVENEVYSHLQTFFSRYYDQGDFISQRRYKADTYAIPYEGEEVKLYWANHDQYYVKSSEHLRDYAFTVHDDDGRTVRIKLVEADTEKDNVKAAADQERRFVLNAEQPLHLDGDELQIRFQYVPAGRKKQDALNAEAVATIFAQSGYDDWLNLLRKPAPTEANAKRTLLEKHLNDYTSRNTFDYFIHKDLGGFLRRELDFYIKSEVLHLDDVDDAAFAVTEAHLRKIRVLRSIAHKIICMLGEIEEFQRRMYLKRKFACDIEYNVVLHAIPAEFYEEIAENAAQWEEWQRVYPETIDHSLSDDTANALSFLENHPTLMASTRHFSDDFVNRLLKSLDDLYGLCSGLLIEADNFQALRLVSKRYSGAIKCIYIDPPYNTGNDDFVYKDGLQRSSWLAMMESRLTLARSMLSEDGVIFISIDDKEYERLKELCAAVFGRQNILNTFSIKTSDPSGHKTVNPSPYSCIEYVLMLCKDRRNYKYETYLVPSAYDTGYNQYVMNWGEEFHKWEVQPIRDAVCAELGFRSSSEAHTTLSKPGFEYKIAEFALKNCKQVFQATAISKDAGKDIVALRDESKKHPGMIFCHQRDNDRIYIRNGRQMYFYSNKVNQTTECGTPGPTKPLTNLWADIPWNGIAKEGGVSLKNGKKPEKLIFRLLSLLRLNSGDTVLDFFSGSGTTLAVAAKMGLNWIGIENDRSASALGRDRLSRVCYGDASGASRYSNEKLRCFKFLRIEGYEDTLNNLVLRGRTRGQQQLLDGSLTLREDYMLGYWLDVETADSPSLLNVEQFEDPFNYKLNISTGSVGAFKPTSVDLVETFNYLLGLRVKTIDTIRGFKVVTGRNPRDESVLVIWRKLKEQDNAALEAFMDKQGYNPRDTEFDRIYVNGDHTLEDPHSKVKMTEIEFKRLMFDVQDV